MSTGSPETPCTTISGVLASLRAVRKRQRSHDCRAIPLYPDDMSDEPGGAGPEVDTTAEPTTEPTGTAMGEPPGERRYEIRIAQIESSAFAIGDNAIAHVFDPESLAVVAATAIYSKAFLEALGKRSGEGVADLPKRLADRLRVRRQARKGKPDELHVGPKDDPSAATLVITEDLSELARLALIDLDVTAEAVRGKTLRWDATVGAWLPEGEGSAQPPISS